ncbi:MAG: pyruvate, phosphate dikinase [Bauldia sp.]|nr:pyruvate, phosphate dikinase [Bauldia sp.]
MAHWVFPFNHRWPAEGPERLALLGGKGAGLAEMAAIGLPVPPGFTISTEVCGHYLGNGRRLPDDLKAEVEAAMAGLAEATGRRFGDPASPLLVSVRSGARVSMPGMMDSVLNLGLNDETVVGLARLAGPRFAYDSYRRFIQMFADVVLGLPQNLFEQRLEAFKEERGRALDTDLDAAEWETVTRDFEALVESELGEPFPQDPWQQLWRAVGAVFGSWQSPRAKVYRSLHAIPEAWGTAVNVQAMVFGNMGETSATGVAFTRDPNTGERGLFGEYLANAQGEDVVAGIRTPDPISEAGSAARPEAGPSLQSLMPDAYAALAGACETLERHFRDLQDIEFTIERGRLWMLQTRSGKRSVSASVRIAVEMAEAGLISRDEALLRIDPRSLEQLLHPTVDPDAKRDLITTGLPASPGAASGEIVFLAEEAEEARLQDRAVILVRTETSPEDIHGMHAAEAILTARGGMTSHAAVVARGMGKPCIAGAGMIRIDLERQVMTVGQRLFRRGDVITVDGSTGEVLAGAAPMRQPELPIDFARLMSWADEARRLKVRANCDTAADAEAARRFGAEGIGLCRTEHMFVEGGRIQAMREIILAESVAERKAALDRLLPMQRGDLTALFRVMQGLPVTVRLLDPPLHEFLPASDAEIAEVAEAMKVSETRLRARIAALSEYNPMLGHRGVRLAISYPEIVAMQTRAILEAALEASATGAPVTPQIMVPLVMNRAELAIVKAGIDAAAAAVARERGTVPAYQVGTMIELPRAALQAGAIAEAAEFFSFGTNDLTQTALGISRDDSAAFMANYGRAGILPRDPFSTLDQEGVGELVRIAVERGRAVRPDIELGICGEHGGDPDSVAFFERAGLDYVSCSPFRVPIARLAAAQAAIIGRAAAAADRG